MIKQILHTKWAVEKEEVEEKMAGSVVSVDKEVEMDKVAAAMEYQLVYYA